MHFVTGGAYNGKSKWVKAFYQLNEGNYQWYSAYRENDMPEADFFEKDIIVLEGMESWLRYLSLTSGLEAGRTKWRQHLSCWMEWEQRKEERQLIMIGCDIAKGIVPIASADRTWRDLTGWAYQDAAASASRVELIWYGVNQTIKGTGK